MDTRTTTMPSSSDHGERPAMLQLRRWRQFRPKIYDFHQVFISPTRRFLLLLSYQCEALLIPLDEDRLCEGFREPRTSKFSGLEKAESCLLDSAQNVGCSTEPVGTGSSEKVPHGSSSLSEQPVVICDVKSLAWVHCGDTYSQHGGSDIREVLVVSGDRGITVHAFSHIDTVCQKIDSLLKTDLVRGKWVEWGPHHNGQTPNKSTSDSNCGEFCKANGIASTDGGQHDHSGVEFSESEASSTTSCWFRTFLIEVDPSEAEGNFVVRFPVRSSIPHSAEVLSFDIFDSVLNFLDSQACKGNCASEDVSETLVSVSFCEDSRSHIQHNGSDTEHRSPTTEAHEHDVVGCVGNRYQCFRVFSSSSNHYIGLVLTHDNDALDSTSSKITTLSKTLVIILVVSHRGMQWVCSVDLQGSCPNLNPVSAWADFQFSEDFLACLNTSGLVCIFDAKTGDIVTHVDVLQTCDVHLKVNSELDQRMCPVKGSYAPVMEKSTTKFPLINDSDEKGRDSENRVSTKRIFRRLFVTSYSQLLAAIDEHGVIYLACIGDYKLEKNGFHKFMPPFQHFGLGILAHWKVAASEISRQKAFSEFLSDQSSSFSSDSDDNLSNINSTGDAECRKNKRQYNQFKGGQMDPYRNVFSAHSQIKICQICQCKLPALYTRRVFLPTDKFSMEDVVCFSPFGIMRFVRRSKSKTKIVHTCLHATTYAYDERDLNNGLHSQRFSSFSEKSALDSETIGCCFEGFLYLVTPEGLFVVLPPLSVSSNVMTKESISYCQSNMSGMCQTETIVGRNGCRDIFRPWQVEVLDRTLLYEGPEEADYVSRRNGWDLKIARMRRLELALCYLKVGEIEGSLEMLADANLAEEGTLRLLLTSAYKIFCKDGSENEIGTASSTAQEDLARNLSGFILLQPQNSSIMNNLLCEKLEGVKPAEVSSPNPLKVGWLRTYHEACVNIDG